MTSTHSAPEQPALHSADGAVAPRLDHPVVWTAVIAALVTLSSLVGLVDPDIYVRETDSWALQAKGQDVGNLVAVLTLVASCRAHVRGSRAAAPVWFGTLFYVVYAFTVYAVAVHFNRLFLVYVAVLAVAVQALLRHVDRLAASAPSQTHGTRLAGATLIGTGGLFAALWLSEILPALATSTPPPSLVEAGLPANPVHVLDLAVVLPGLVLTGLSLLRGGPHGRSLAGPWLVFSVLMGTSIVAAMVLLVAEGDTGAWPPMVGVGAIVLLSLTAACRHLRSRSRARPRGRDQGPSSRVGR